MYGLGKRNNTNNIMIGRKLMRPHALVVGGTGMLRKVFVSGGAGMDGQCNRKKARASTISG